MQQPRVRLRTMIAAIALLALALTVVVWSRQAEAEFQRAQAEAQFRRSQAILEEMNGGIARQQPSPPDAATQP